MTGMTLHETTDFLDGGEIIFQTASSMVRVDTLHRLAARNVDLVIYGVIEGREPNLISVI